MNYLLPGVKKAWQDALTVAGIAFKRTRYSRINGLLVSADDLMRAIEVIGMELDDTRETLSPKPDVTIIYIRPVAGTQQGEDVTEPEATTGSIPMLTVTTEGASIKQSFLNWLIQTMEEQLKNIGKPVVIHGPVKGFQEPVVDGRFHIWIHAAASPTAEHQNVPDTWMNHEMHAQRDGAYAPSGMGIELKQQDRNYVAGELVGRDNLYIHHNLGTCGCGQEGGFFKSILRLVLAARPLTEAEQAAAKNHQRVTFESWSHDTLDRGYVHEMIREILLPIIGRDISVTGRTKQTFRPVDSPSQFRIRFWSAAKDGSTRTVPSTLWGISTRRRNDESFLPSGLGIPIADPETGWAVAELLNDYLYIHYDLSNDDTADTRSILRRLFEEVAQAMQESAEAREARLEAYRAAAREAARKLYLEKCLERHQKLLSDQEYKVSEKTGKVEDLRRALTELIRETLQEERILEAMRRIDDNHALYEQEYNSLLTITEVADVQMHGNALHIFTNVIYCTDPRDNKVHELGKYRIEIYLRGTVRWFNLDGPKKGYDGYKFQAPHVREDGSACLGRMEEVFPDLIARGEFSVAAQVAIAFLQALNVTDPTENWGPTNIHSWPVVELPTQTQE